MNDELMLGYDFQVFSVQGLKRDGFKFCVNVKN